MSPFEILPHTADIRLKVSGKNLQDLFEQAVLGMAQILKQDISKSYFKYQISKIKIKVKADNETILLIDFLSEVLTASYEEKTVFYKVNFLKITENELDAEIFGGKIDSFDEDIKAVTYHEAKIKKINSGYETIIVFDI
ncbi:MAG: archease [Patescibacteria group bacterium]